MKNIRTTTTGRRVWDPFEDEEGPATEVPEPIKQNAHRPEESTQQMDFIMFNPKYARFLSERENLVVGLLQFKSNLAQYKNGFDKTIPELQKLFFWWLSVRKLQMAFERLQKKGILKNTGVDKRPNYEINQKRLDQLARKFT